MTAAVPDPRREEAGRLKDYLRSKGIQAGVIIVDRLLAALDENEQLREALRQIARMKPEKGAKLERAIEIAEKALRAGGDT